MYLIISFCYLLLFIFIENDLLLDGLYEYSSNVLLIYHCLIFVELYDYRNVIDLLDETFFYSLNVKIIIFIVKL